MTPPSAPDGRDAGTPVDLVVVGLGYVGLPLAARACEAGVRTIGLDVSAEVADGLNAGRSHVGDVPDSVVADMVAAGFTATTAPSVLAAADTIVLCVPTGCPHQVNRI